MRWALLLLSTFACGESPRPTANPTSSSPDAIAIAPDAGAPDAGDPGPTSADAALTVAPDTSTRDAAEPFPTPDAAVEDAGGAIDPSPAIPRPTGVCPTIAAGDVSFAPAGLAPRRVRLALDPSRLGAGPLVLYWHATGSAPLEAGYALGRTLDEIVAAGGVVAAPYADASAGSFEWFVVNGSAREDDFLLADEIVACLAEAGAIDVRRVHSLGMSAGALQTTALSFLRSTYVASVATYSGGVPAGYVPTVADADNKFAAMIFKGGASDVIFGVDFAAASEAYRAMLSRAGHFTVMCDHGQGHQIPLDAAPSVLAFFRAHPLGASPSPYATTGLPADFPRYCGR